MLVTGLTTYRLRAMERLIPVLDRWSGREQQSSTVENHLVLGERGEEAAFFHLRRMGRVVVARRWISAKQPGDLDLVAWDGEALCFIEVKTRSTCDAMAPEDAVDADKRRSVRRMARLYLRSLPQEPSHVRFDIVSVCFSGGKPEIRVIQSAFGWSEPAHHWH